MGRGGMAETYRSRLLGAAGVTKPVLIKKILPEHAANPDFTTMFIREARISASLSHANIAQVYDFGCMNEEYFLAMEYVDGQPLNRLAKRALHSGFSVIPIPLALFICGEICRGLHYAHTRVGDDGQPLEIVHRDIAPDNVLISYEGQIKIVDFGIAKAREPHGPATEPGIIKGKFLYLSPEQARGQPVDARTDVWATGVVLYQLLCGRLPVEGPQYMAMHRLSKGEFPHPHVLNPELPLELDAIVMKALAVKREERYASCLAFGDALTEFLSSLPCRVSAMSLSYFMQELFREDLRAEGREVQVPATFQEQFIRWRAGTAPSSRAVPPPPPQEVQTDIRRVVTPPRSSRLGPLLAVGMGSALLGAGLTFALSRPAPSPPPPVSRLEPVARPPEPMAPRVQEGAPKAPEPEPPIATPLPPEPSKPASPKAREAEAAHEKAHRAFQQKVFKRAAALSDKCTQFDPGFIDCLLLAGEAYARLGQEPKAVDRYKAALRLETSYERAGELRKTLRKLESKVAYEQGRALFRAKRFQEALSHAGQCIAQEPESAVCHLLAGDSSARLGQHGSAAASYRKFLEITPEHKAAPRIRGVLSDYAEE